jgi:hypothetical protein
LFATNTLQNLLFCIAKAAVLHAKSVGFASQKSRFRNVKAQLSLFNRIIFTKQRLFQAVITKYKGVSKLTFDTPFPKYYNLTAMLHKALCRVKQ